MKNLSWVVLAVRNRFWDAPGRAQDGVWIPKCHPKTDLGTPRARQLRPEPSKSRPEDVPRPSRRPVRAHVGHQASSNASSKRFVVAFVLRHGSSDVFISVFTMFCCLRTKLAPNAYEHRQSAEIEAFRPPKSSPGTSAGPKIEPKRLTSSGKARPKRLQGLRKFQSQRKRGHFERARAPASGQDERPSPNASRRFSVFSRWMSTVS